MIDLKMKKFNYHIWFSTCLKKWTKTFKLTKTFGTIFMKKKAKSIKMTILHRTPSVHHTNKL